MSESEASRGIVTRTCELRLEGDIVVGRFLDGAEVQLDDARENLAATARLHPGGAVPVLVDLRRVRSQTAEARAYFAGAEGSRVSRAVALLVDSALSRIIGNFYLGFNRPGTPTRLFTSEDEARAWLRAFTASAA